MKFFLSILLVALVSFAACLYLPWWSIAAAGFLVAVAIPQRPFASFLAGFLGAFLLWVILSAITSSANGHVLAQKIAQLILKTGSPWLLIAVTGLLGGLVAGLGALTGSFIRRPAAQQ
ncbi:MAG: hypothetical protein QM687_09605 [Ferruginibacter sp.]